MNTGRKALFGAALAGQASMLSDNRFRFKPAGANPSDPGLTFGKQNGRAKSRNQACRQPLIEEAKWTVALF